MTASGTLIAHFKILCQEFALADELRFQERACEPLIVLRSTEGGISMEITLNNVEEEAGEKTANSLAKSVLRHILFNRAGSIPWAKVDHIPKFTFCAATDSTSVHYVCSGAVGYGEAVSCAIVVSPGNLKPIVRMAIKRPDIPDRLQPAVDVFEVGMAVEDPVTRFIIHYNAAALLAEAVGTGSGQSDIDNLLCEIDSSIVRTRTGRPRGKTQDRDWETPYTKARNDLIHAHDRGQDPKKARAAVTSQVSGLQRLVGVAIAERWSSQGPMT